MGQRIAVVVQVTAVGGVIVRAYELPAVPELGAIGKFEQVTRVALGVGKAIALAVIVRHVFQVDLAGAARHQISELAGQHRAAVAVDARIQRGVVVRRQVQVIRRAHLETGAAGVADGRIQEAALAPVVDRKAEIRQVQEGHVAQPHGGVARHAHARFLVDGDRLGAKLPQVMADIASGIRGHRVARVLRIQHVTLFRHAVAACIEHLVAHVVGDAAAGLGIAAHVRRRQQLAGLLVAHVAAGVVIGVDVVVVDTVGLQLLVGALQFHVAGQVVDRLVGAVHMLRLNLGKAGFAQADVLAEAGVVEIQQGIRAAHGVVVGAWCAVKRTQRTGLFGLAGRGGRNALTIAGVGLAADQGKCCGNCQQAAWG